LKQPFTWICNFNPTAPVSQTKKFCINLPSKAECLYSGHPAQGGIPFAALRATVSELRLTLARSNLVLFCEPNVQEGFLEHPVKHSQSSQKRVVGNESLEHHAENNRTSQTHVVSKGALIQLHKPCADDEERSAHCTVFIKMFPQCSNPPHASCTKVNHTKYLLERHFKPFCAKTFRFCSPETVHTTAVPISGNTQSQIWTAASTELPGTTAIPKTDTEFPGTTGIPTTETKHNDVPEVIPTEFPGQTATSRTDTKHDDMAQATSTETPGTTATLSSDTMQDDIAKLIPPEAPGSTEIPGTAKKQKDITQGPSTARSGSQENKLKVKSVNTGQSASDEVDLTILRGVSEALRSLSPMFDHMVNTTEALLTS